MNDSTLMGSIAGQPIAVQIYLLVLFEFKKV